MTMPKDQFRQSLQRLETMSKGQLHHTGSDSNPGNWGNGQQTDLDEHNDSIDANGTDYEGVKKSLAAKVENCEALTPAEVCMVKGIDPSPYIQELVDGNYELSAAEEWYCKGGYQLMGAALAKGNAKPTAAGTPGEAKDRGSVPDSHVGGGEDEIEADAKKSFEAAVNGNQTLQDGLELSPFLVEFTRAMAEGFQGVEGRVLKSLQEYIGPLYQHIEYLEGEMAKSFGDQGEFNKGFAETLVGIGQHVAGGQEVQQYAQGAPQYAPKSHLRSIPGGQQGQQVQSFEKSFGPGGLDVGTGAMAKSTVVNAMTDLCKGGSLNSLDVIKFEMTGEITPEVEQMVTAHLGGNR